MKSFFSLSDTGNPAFPYAVSRIYRILADSSYHVYHAPCAGGTFACVFVTGGDGIFKRSGITRTLAHGDYLVFDASAEPFEYFTFENRWEFWWFEYTAPLPIKERSLRISAMNESFLSMLAEYSLAMHRAGQYAEASAFFGAFAAYADGANSQSAGVSAQDTFLTAQAAVHNHLKTATVASIAAKAGVSARTLDNLFIQHLNLSPKQYIMKVKMETSEYLLRNTSKSVAEISDSLGFSSSFHFSKCFKQYHAVSPSVYRKFNHFLPTQNTGDSRD